ncbi:MAG: MFS transporter [Lachnospiraceae bacterium]
MRTKKIICCGGLMIGMCISMLLQTQLTTAMPAISEEFGTTSFYAWIYSSYMLASSVTIPFFGRVCERYGYRQNYFVGGILFFLGTLGSALAPNMLLLVLFRILTGFGAGIVIPATYGIIGTLFKKEDMRKVFGLMTVVQIVNKGLGSVLGGYFSTNFTWRYGLLILVPIELIGALLVVFSTNDKQQMKNDMPISMKSACFMTSALLITMYGLEMASNQLSAVSIIILLIGLACMIAFIIREHRADDGILPKEIINSRALKGLLLEVFLLGAVMNICFVYFPLYMVSVFAWTTSRAGVVLLIYIVTMGIASAASAFIKEAAAALTKFSWILFIAGAVLGYTSFLANMTILFYASNVILGLSVGVLSSVVLGDIQVRIEGSSASTNGIAHLMRNIGSAIGVTAFSPCLSVSWLVFPGLALIGVISATIQGLIVNRQERR